MVDLKGFYFSIEDKWYSFIDKVSDKVSFVGKSVDWIEDKGIPSFPLFILILIVLLFLIFFLLNSSGKSLVVGVYDVGNNPVVGAKVSVFLDGILVGDRLTDSSGKAVFFLDDEDYSLKVEKNGFNDFTRAGVSPTGVEEKIGLVKESETITKAIALKSKIGELINGSGIVKYTCISTNQQKIGSYSNGVFIADFTDCDEIRIDDISGYSVLEGSISFSGVNNVVLEEVVRSVGTITATITANNDLAGVVVTVRGEDGTPVQTRTLSASTNVVIFEDMLAKKYYVTVSSPQGVFVDYDGSSLGEIKELRANETISFNIVLQRTNSSEIKVSIVDFENGLPITGAEVKLFSENNTLVNSEITNTTGQIVFRVPSNTNYIIGVEHPQYLIGQTIRTSSGQELAVELVKANENNAQSLLVRIVDGSGEEIQNVNVVLKKLDDSVVSEKATGANGEVEFYNLELLSYYVYAVKDGFKGVTSSAIQIMPRRQNVLDVVLDLGEGLFDVSVVNESLDSVSNAKIIVIDFFTNSVVEEKFSDNSGKASFRVRADKKVFFVVEVNDYLKYHTIASYPNVGSTIVRNVQMVKETGKLSARIKGVFLAGEELGSESGISAGVYNVIGLLEVPKGNYSEIGFHLRTGKSVNNSISLMEEDTTKIGSVNSSASTVIRGTSFFPLNGYNVDSKNLTKNNSKWVDFKWVNVKEGVYEVEAELVIEETPMNNEVNLWYRGWIKGSNTLRDPVNNNSGHELYASAKNHLLVSGAVSTCKNNFCASNEIKTLTGSNTNRVQFISNRFNGVLNNSYELTTKLVSRKNLSNLVLDVDASGIDVTAVLVNGVEREGVINLGNLSVDSYTEIKIIFTTMVAGASEIKIGLNSAVQNEFEQNILISVPANKKFSLDMTPRQIIPFIDNPLLFEVIDNNVPLKDVIIEISSNNDYLATIKTNSEGLAQYVLTNPNISDVIKVRASKEEYDLFELTREVDDRVLIITPPEITNTIKIGEIASIEETIVLENATTKKLKIEGISFSGELNSLLNISLNEEIKGKEIGIGSDFNYNIKIRPNANAQRLIQPTTVEGYANIVVSVDGTMRKFEQRIPVKIRLSKPGYIDSVNCLRINPNSIEFNASTKETTQVVEIENNCTAEGITVNLSDLEVRVNEASKFGNISVNGVSVSENFVLVNNLVERNAKGTLTIRFVPNQSINSGKQDLRIIFKAKNFVDDDFEEISSEVSAKISMSNLLKCVEIKEPAGGIYLDVASWNLGVNRIMTSNLSAHAQQNIQNYPGFSNHYSNPYSSMGAYGAMLPFMNFEGSNQYEQNNFVIENNCAVGIDIDLVPDSRLIVNEQKFSISSGSSASVIVSPGYTLGKYAIGVSAKLSDSEDSKSSIGNVNVIVRRLGELDPNCIKVNVNKLIFNSFLYTAEQYKVFNYCYNSGVYLDRVRTVTIDCDAPNAVTNQDVRYLQVGQEQFYSNNYPLTQQYPSHNSYLYPSMYANNQNTSTCGSSNCAMIAGTRTLNYRTIDSSSGTTEEITFEVMPSASYMPQRKLFDSQRNVYGLFQNLSDIRQWATETDARTGVYGTMNVTYSNQYGSQQCLTFPITIEDNWRILESIDSAVNWGDPNAMPQECVGNLEKTALDIVAYWKNRGNTKGNVPDAEFTNKGLYKHISEPPAVNIGPGKSNTIQNNKLVYAQPGMVNPQTNPSQITQSLYTKSSAKNCGLLDSITDLRYDNSFGGVTIKISSSNSGSLVNNTLGPNLWVEVDRSGIQHECVYINTSVTGKLSRVINMQSAQITWPVKILVTRPGFKIPDDFTPETSCFVAEHGSASDDSSSGSDGVVGECVLSASEFGFDLVDKINAKDLSLSELTNYCENNFCNNEMLQLFVLEKLNRIREELISNGSEKIKSGVLLSEIYRLAPEVDLNVCVDNKNVLTKFYAGKNNVAVVSVFGVSDFVNEQDKTIIIGAKEGALPLAQMQTVIQKIKSASVKEFDELFVKYSDGKGNTRFLSAETYLKLNAEVASNVANNKNVKEVVVCDNKIDSKFLEEMVKGSPTLVKLIKVDDKITKQEVDLIYQNNENLKKISVLKEFNDNLLASGKAIYLTAENNTIPVFQKTLFNKIGNYLDNVSSISLSASGLSGVGKYALSLDGKTNEIIANNGVITLKFSDKNIVKKSADNILLKRGFSLSVVENTSKGNNSGLLIDDSGKVYARTPILLNLNLHSLEPSITYSTENNSSDNSLIKWFDGNGKMFTDSHNGVNYVLELGVSKQNKNLKGLYYYPTNGTMYFNTRNNDGATINGKAIVLNEGRTQTINVKANKSAFDLGQLTMPTTEQIITLIKNNTACLTDNGNKVIWNEKELLKK